eukprot:7831620-Pyramimonas_sp.AAC.1
MGDEMRVTTRSRASIERYGGGLSKMDREAELRSASADHRLAPRMSALGHARMLRRGHGHNLSGCRCVDQVAGYIHTPAPSHAALTRPLTTCPAGASAKIGG